MFSIAVENMLQSHDHLPSCFHVVMTENAQQAQEPFVRVHELSQIYYWSNSYQSPYLGSLNPLLS